VDRDLTDAEVAQLRHELDVATSDVVYLAAENERLLDEVSRALTFLSHGMPLTATVTLRKVLA
jgi:hypothetical protein